MVIWAHADVGGLEGAFFIGNSDEVRLVYSLLEVHRSRVVQHIFIITLIFIIKHMVLIPHGEPLTEAVDLIFSKTDGDITILVGIDKSETILQNIEICIIRRCQQNWFELKLTRWITDSN